MSGTKITLTGVDEAHFLSVSKETSRLVKFPDGVSRHITLSNWHWEVLDRLHKDKGWSKREIPNMAYNQALKGFVYPDDFEKELRLTFSTFIEINMAYVMKENEDWTVANQFEFVSTGKDDL